MRRGAGAGETLDVLAPLLGRARVEGPEGYGDGAEAGWADGSDEEGDGLRAGDAHAIRAAAREREAVAGLAVDALMAEAFGGGEEALLAEMAMLEEDMEEDMGWDEEEDDLRAGDAHVVRGAARGRQAVGGLGEDAAMAEVFGGGGEEALRADMAMLDEDMGLDEDGGEEADGFRAGGAHELASAVAEVAAELGCERLGRSDAEVGPGGVGGSGPGQPGPARGAPVAGVADDLALLVRRCCAVGLRVTDVPCAEGDCLFGAVGAGVGADAAVMRGVAVAGLKEKIFAPMGYEEWEDWVGRWCPRKLPPPAGRPKRAVDRQALRARVTGEVVAAWSEGGRRVEAGRQCLDALSRQQGVCVKVYALEGGGVPVVKDTFAPRSRSVVKVLLHREHYYALSDAGAG
jgi:hypothetical protein